MAENYFATQWYRRGVVVVVIELPSTSGYRDIDLTL